MSSNRISIRSYTNQMRSHFHEYHQLVLPLQGSINIQVGNYKGLVSIGDCIIIKAGQRHDFFADEAARFIVVDLDDLPNNIKDSTNEKVSIDTPLIAFIQFVDKQLNSQVSHTIEITMVTLFYQLLALQPLLHKVDKRIAKVISIISHDLSKSYSNNELAQYACLSVTQFKKIFKQSIGLSCQKYLTKLRMEKAKALITHTDTPISIIADLCGYQSPSAFSRKFKDYFGDTPKSFTF